MFGISCTTLMDYWKFMVKYLAQIRVPFYWSLQFGTSASPVLNPIGARNEQIVQLLAPCHQLRGALLFFFSRHTDCGMFSHRPPYSSNKMIYPWWSDFTNASFNSYIIVYIAGIMMYTVFKVWREKRIIKMIRPALNEEDSEDLNVKDDGIGTFLKSLCCHLSSQA